MRRYGLPHGGEGQKLKFSTGVFGQRQTADITRKQCISSHNEKIVTYTKCPNAATDQSHITATDGRQRRPELVYVFQCSDTIVFLGYVLFVNNFLIRMTDNS